MTARPTSCSGTATTPSASASGTCPRAEENTLAGPFHRWPLGRGFEHFYGFLGGETSQWYPDLVQDNASISQPKPPEEGYHLSADLADQAIRFVLEAHVNAPEKPFFMYCSPGCAHAPHHAPKDWIERYRGRFDAGWDAYRQEAFTRQKEVGLLPADVPSPGGARGGALPAPRVRAGHTSRAPSPRSPGCKGPEHPRKRLLGLLLSNAARSSPWTRARNSRTHRRILCPREQWGGPGRWPSQAACCTTGAALVKGSPRAGSSIPGSPQGRTAVNGKPREGREWAMLVTLRSLATAVVLIAAYYLLPLGSAFTIGTVAYLTGGIVVVAVLLARQTQVIIRSPRPRLRAGGADREGHTHGRACGERDT